MMDLNQNLVLEGPVPAEGKFWYFYLLFGVCF